MGGHDCQARGSLGRRAVAWLLVCILLPLPQTVVSQDHRGEAGASRRLHSEDASISGSQKSLGHGLVTQVDGDGGGTEVKAAFHGSSRLTRLVPLSRSDHRLGSSWVESAIYDERMPSRFAEVRERCLAAGGRDDGVPASLSADGFHTPVSEGDPTWWVLQSRLSFQNGDWLQSEDSKPIMLYNPLPEPNSSRRDSIPRYPTFDELDASTPVQLATFSLTDMHVNKNAGGSKNIVNVSGVLQLAITSRRSIFYGGGIHPRFEMTPGFSQMSIELEGVSIETEKEYTLCMLGCTLFPAKEAKQLTKDCNVMVQLQYPRRQSLTNRAIHGQVTSIAAPGDNHYFNPINVSSQMEAFADYEYTAGALTAGICNETCPQSSSKTDTFRGPKFCEAALQLIAGQWLDVEPFWQCTQSEEFCFKLAPFGFGASHGANVPRGRLLIQYLRCDALADGMGAKSNTHVSAVFRAVLGGESPNLAFQRSGLNGHTLAAEGSWRNESGQICMVACHAGAKNSDMSGDCDIKICLHIQAALSLKQRSIVEGTISSIWPLNHSGSFNPLSFHMSLHNQDVPASIQKQLRYKYDNIREAGAVMERYEPNLVRSRIRASVFRYPALHGLDDYNILSRDLSVESLLLPQQKKQSRLDYLSFSVIALEDHMTINWREESNFTLVPEGQWMMPLKANPRPSAGRPSKQPEFFKVGAHLKITPAGFSLENPLVYFAEGLYNPKDGKMYMKGCRPVDANWTLLQDNADSLDDGLDCSLEIVLEYPSVVARWLTRPTVKIDITSRRNVDEAFYFKPMNLETYPITYKRQRDEIISRKSLEGSLSVATLTLMLLCIGAQLSHVKRHPESTPYISLGMLGVQAVGYIIPLITGAEALFARMNSDTEVDTGYNPLREGQWTQSIMFLVKSLTLVAFLLIIRLAEKVWKERMIAASQAELKSAAVELPRESNVILVCGITHVVSFLVVLAVQVARTNHDQTAAIKEVNDLQMSGTPVLQKEAKEYWGLVEDLFLLPQVVGSALWVVKGEPLHVMYYIGVTMLRLLPHMYDRLRTPPFYPYSSDYIYANPAMDFYSKAGDIVIPVLALTLAAMVYVQQRWKGVLVVRTRSLYDRLPAKNLETELVSSNLSPRGVLTIIQEDDD